MRLAILATFALLSAAPALRADPGVRPGLAPDEVLLEVNGIGIVQSRADRIVVTAMVRSEAATLVQSRKANDAQVAGLVAAARSMGIAETDIRTNPEQPGLVGNEAVGWSVFAPKGAAREATIGAIEIRLADASRFEALRAALEKAGADQVTGPTYSLADDHSARAEAKARAVADGRAQAEIYARATQMRVGRLLRISERSSSTFDDAAAVQEMLKAMAGQGGKPAGVIDTRVRVALDFALVPVR